MEPKEGEQWKREREARRGERYWLFRKSRRERDVHGAQEEVAEEEEEKEDEGEQEQEEQKQGKEERGE